MSQFISKWDILVRYQTKKLCLWPLAKTNSGVKIKILLYHWLLNRFKFLQLLYLQWLNMCKKNPNQTKTKLLLQWTMYLTAWRSSFVDNHRSKMWDQCLRSLLEKGCCTSIVLNLPSSMRMKNTVIPFILLPQQCRLVFQVLISADRLTESVPKEYKIIWWGYSTMCEDKNLKITLLQPS